MFLKTENRRKQQLAHMNTHIGMNTSMQTGIIMNTQPRHRHTHDHSHSHAHGRSLSAIRKLIQETSLPVAVKNTAISTFELLGTSEARIHNVPVENIHFHEVGAVDAIVDIVSASAGMHALNIEKCIARLSM